MLKFFPTPYPDEWWYSVLCRYHVRSGNISAQATNRELFHGRQVISMSALFPSQAIQVVVSQLPRRTFSIESIMLEHTLFQYYMRFFNLSYKEEVFDSLCKGRGLSGTLWSAFSSDWLLSYCPCCIKEDTERFGEPYWHKEHQIPEMHVCTKHGCKLNYVPLEYTRRVSQHYYPLSAISVDMECRQPEQWEIDLAKILHAYLELPMEVSPPSSKNSNLARALFNEKLGSISKEGMIYLDSDKVYERLKQIYPMPFLTKCIPETNTQQSTVFRAIRTWKTKRPERYALLQLLVGMDMDTFFSNEPIPLTIVEKLHEMQYSGARPSKKEVLDALGVNNAALDRIANLEHIKPFWTHIEKSDEPRKTIRLQFNESEYRQIKQAASKAGYRFLTDYVIDMLRKSL